jgi:TolB-like protein/tetratricopeptide (TPR) repeat protein
LSLFEELKRRKVVRVAVVYAATAFAVLQAADIMLPQMNVPDWAMGLLVAFVVFGFPIALVLAWALEVTPDGIKRTEAAPAERSDAATPALLGKRTVLAAALLVAVGVGLGAGWFLRPATESPSGSPPAASLAPAVAENAVLPPVSLSPVAKSIAVLPFVNMSADAENEYFADGISEELLNVLVKVEDIGVASRTSSFAYKGRELGAAVIARELKVNHILEGSVRKSGNRVRITAQLIDAVEDRHLWSETYDRELDDIFAIQDEIANAIVAALRGTLGMDEVPRVVMVRADTENLDAYQLYLKARELFITRTALDESVRLAEEVVALDPEFARGWELLAASSAVIIDWEEFYPGVDTGHLSVRALEAAERALALDPTLALPWAARALLMSYQMPIPFAESLVLFDKALSADPAQASVYLWRAISWVNLGFLERAMHDVDACLVIDPAYGNCLRWKAQTAALMGNDALALELYERGIATGFVANRADTLIERLVARGDRLAAMLLMGQLEMPPELQQAIIGAIEQGAPPAQLAELLARHPRFDTPTWHLALRAYDRAAAWEGRITTLVSYWDPVHTGFRNSPAFRRILEYLGVPAYWREHGYPPLCRPVGADDYECAQ